MEHKGYNNTIVGAKNNLKTYQGQEFTEDLGVNVFEFKYRMHDPALGRFWQVDPLTEDYKDWGPYVFSGNRVIDSWELEGLEPHSVHKTLDGAATNFAQQYNGRSIIQKREYGSRFYSRTKNGVTTYSYVEPNRSASGSTGVFIPDESTLPEGTSNAGTIHSHGNDEKEENKFESDADNEPSFTDIENTKESGLPGFVVTPKGTLEKIDPKTGEYNPISTEIPSDPASGKKRVNSINPTLAPYVPSRPKAKAIEVKTVGVKI